jgi:hypothetical protein
MVLSEKSATFRGHALGANIGLGEQVDRRILTDGRREHAVEDVVGER